MQAFFVFFSKKLSAANLVLYVRENHVIHISCGLRFFVNIHKRSSCFCFQLFYAEVRRNMNGFPVLTQEMRWDRIGMSMPR